MTDHSAVAGVGPPDAPLDRLITEWRHRAEHYASRGGHAVAATFRRCANALEAERAALQMDSEEPDSHSQSVHTVTHMVPWTRASGDLAIIVDRFRPCNCGADVCIGQSTLLDGYRCVREVGFAALRVAHPRAPEETKGDEESSTRVGPVGCGERQDLPRPATE